MIAFNKISIFCHKAMRTVLALTILHINIAVTSLASTQCDQKIINEVESYIKNLKSMRARFTQSDQNHHILQKGVIKLQKPGKLRWEYLHPKHILILVHDKETTYYDYSLNEKSQIKSDSIIIRLLLSTSINLKRTYLTQCSTEGEFYLLTFTPPTQNQNEIEKIIITAKLLANPVRFIQFEMRNQNHQILNQLQLQNIQHNPILQKDSFQLPDQISSEKQITGRSNENSKQH
jgi:outer membrane lipoprotein-sorting protein